MKVFAVIEKDGTGNEKVIALYSDVNDALEGAKGNGFNFLFRKITRSVEAMKVIGADEAPLDD